MIYELHVGTFTPEGTYAGVVKKLETSGRPRRHCDRADAARRLRRQAQLGLRRRAAVRAGLRLRHGPRSSRRWSTRRTRAGLMVLLDVVYNHFGPKGNYLHALRAAVLHRAPQDAVGRGDRLRQRGGAPVFLHPQRALLARGVPLRRPALRRGARDRRRLRRATSSTRSAPRSRPESTWCWRTTPTRRASSARAATPRSGTTIPTTPTTCSPPASATATTSPTPIRRPGTSRAASPRASPTRARSRPSATKPRGEPSAHLPPSCFVDFLQNHDQIGNRAFGERLITS